MSRDLRLVALNAKAVGIWYNRSESHTVTYCSLNGLLESLSGKSSFLPA